MAQTPQSPNSAPGRTRRSSSRARCAAVPQRPRRPTRAALVRRRIRRRGHRRADCDGRQQDRPRRAGYRRRRALPGRRLSRAWLAGPRGRCDVGEPDAARRRHRRGPRTRPHPRRHGGQRDRGGPRFPQRRHRRPVRASLDAHRTDARGTVTDPPRRRGLRVGVDSRCRPRRGVLRTRAGLDRRPRNPSGDQQRRTDRHRDRRPADTAVQLRRHRPGGGAAGDPDAGGTVGATRQHDFGAVLDVTDPQGGAFAVFEPNADIRRAALNGSGPGELSYITHYVPDSRVSRDFYGRVLHWTFEPGRVDDGWGVQGANR